MGQQDWYWRRLRHLDFLCEKTGSCQPNSDFDELIACLRANLSPGSGDVDGLSISAANTTLASTVGSHGRCGRAYCVLGIRKHLIYASNLTVIDDAKPWDHGHCVIPEIRLGRTKEETKNLKSEYRDKRDDLVVKLAEQIDNSPLEGPFDGTGAPAP